jgi:hypothetical protein
MDIRNSWDSCPVFQLVYCKMSVCVCVWTNSFSANRMEREYKTQACACL